MASFDTREQIEMIAKSFGELIRKEFAVKKIYLYGSYAKGNYTQDSDIDIAVIADDFTGDPIEDTMKLMKLRREIDIRIEPRPYRTSDFSLTNPIAKEIMETGIVIL